MKIIWLCDFLLLSWVETLCETFLCISKFIQQLCVATSSSIRMLLLKGHELFIYMSFAI